MSEVIPSNGRFTREFDEWNDVTGAIPDGIGWHHECRSIFEDADKEIERLRTLANHWESIALGYYQRIEQASAHETNGCRVCEGPMPPLSDPPWISPICPTCDAKTARGLCVWCEHPLRAEAASPQAPIARINVHKGNIRGAIMYTPSLPDGEHDLYCVPEATAPMMPEKTSADVTLCPTCSGLGAIRVRMPTDQDNGTDHCPDCVPEKTTGPRHFSEQEGKCWCGALHEGKPAVTNEETK